jgi:predicted O-methyltransferase YrrM
MTTPWDAADDIAAEDLETYKAAATDPTEDALFEAWTADLPLSEVYGLGAHSLPALRWVVENIEPRSILEIGFGAGASSSMFLRLASSAFVHSVDNTENWKVILAALHMERKWHPRFLFHHGDSKTTLSSLFRMLHTFGLAFIDGAHDYESVAADLDGVLRLGVPWILVDDWWPLLGPGVRRAVEERRELTKVRQFGNLVLLESARKGAGDPGRPRRDPDTPAGEESVAPPPTVPETPGEAQEKPAPTRAISGSAPPPKPRPRRPRVRPGT